VRQLCDLHDVVDCPNAVRHVVKRIEEEQTVLHGDVVSIAEFEVGQEAEENSRPHDKHNEVRSMESRIERAVSVELGRDLQEVDTPGQVRQNNRLVAHRELCVLDKVLVGVAATNAD